MPIARQRKFKLRKWLDVHVTLLHAIAQAKLEKVDEVNGVLLSTQNSIIAEAVERDVFWGSGYNRFNTASMDPIEWPGLNHMGKIRDISTRINP